MCPSIKVVAGVSALADVAATSGWHWARTGWLDPGRCQSTSLFAPAIATMDLVTPEPVPAPPLVPGPLTIS